MERKEQRFIKKEELEQLLEELLEDGGSKSIFLICGHSFEALPLWNALKEYAEKKSVELVRFSDFHPNPDIEDARKAAAAMELRSPGLLMAAGGGSAIDTAKCALRMLKKRPPFFAVPTTAGSGAESTCFAVVYENGNKVSFDELFLMPDAVLLDEECVATLPLKIRRSTFFDAVAHGVESYWARRSSPESREVAGEALKTLLAAKDVYFSTEGKENGASVLLGANLAGRAIQFTRTTASHAMAYKLTTLYGFPHGHAVALTLPESWKYLALHAADTEEKRDRDWLEQGLTELSGIFGAKDPLEGAKALAGLREELELTWGRPAPSEEELITLSGSVNVQRLSNYPVAMDQDALKALYREALI